MKSKNNLPFEIHFRWLLYNYRYGAKREYYVLFILPFPVYLKHLYDLNFGN